jgi:hypothetical protein
MCGGVKVQIHAFLMSALYEGERVCSEQGPTSLPGVLSLSFTALDPTCSKASKSEDSDSGNLIA